MTITTTQINNAISTATTNGNFNSDLIENLDVRKLAIQEYINRLVANGNTTLFDYADSTSQMTPLVNALSNDNDEVLDSVVDTLEKINESIEVSEKKIETLEKKLETKIAFGIDYVSSDYRDNEILNFCNQFASEWTTDFCDRYKSFLNGLLNKTVKASTLVDVDVLKEFKNDCENRYEIDFWDDENRKEFGNKALYFKKLSDHITKILK